MTKDIIMCKAGRRPSHCYRNCTECAHHDSVMLDFCDICGEEIDWDEKPSDYHNPETGQDICKDCREKNMYERE